MENNGTKKELWAIYHGYSVDGGYGDAIWEEEMTCAVEATEAEIEEFVKKYDNPIVYDRPYDDLTAHHIRAEKIVSMDISDARPYGPDDYFGRQAEEYSLREKYNERYGRNWMWSDEREGIYEKFNQEMDQLRKKYEEDEIREEEN